MSAFFILLAGSLWGIISIFVDSLNSIGFDSMECVAIRNVFATIILFVILCIKDRNLLKIEIRHIGYFFGTGICSIVFFNCCYFEAIKRYDGASIPALLLYTAPMFVMVMSAIFFKEKITKKKVVALIVTFIGLGFVTGAFSGHESISFSVFMLGLGAGFGYALYSIFAKFVIGKYDTLTITFYTFLIATIGSVPISKLLRDVNMLFDSKNFAVAMMFAVCSTVLPYLFYTKGLEKVEASVASILATIEPFVAAIVGFFVFKETMDFNKAIGMILILSAIICLNIKKKK